MPSLVTVSSTWALSTITHGCYNSFFLWSLLPDRCSAQWLPFLSICFSLHSEAPIRHGRLLPTCAHSPTDEKWQKQVLKVEVLAYCSECIKNHSQTPHKEFYTHTLHTIQGRQRSRRGDNHSETSNHNRSLERWAQGKLLSQTGWWIVSSAGRQTARGTYFYKKLTERTPDIQACSLLIPVSRADSALCFPLQNGELFHALVLIIHIQLLSFLTRRLNVYLSELEPGWMLNSLL